MSNEQKTSMLDGPPFRQLLRSTCLALAVCAALVTTCYYSIDRPVAFYVHNHHVNQHEIFKWLTYPPPWVQTWSPLMLVMIVVMHFFGETPRAAKVSFVACISLIVADQFRASLGELFGRYWPETWIDNNPSLIGDNIYGFHPFQSGDATGSFPSGHAARILGFLSVFWIAMPRGRAFYGIIAIPMLVSLVAMNYHFVGDVIAGSFVGAIVGQYAVILATFSEERPR
jgi:membrane-associated phospholipid phosphatase